MAYDQTTVRKVLDQARADGRGALTAPQARVLCEAYGIAVPQEGVATNAAEAAQEAFNSIVANARRYQADATIEGVQVQQMLTGGQEVIIGAVTDPAFGKLVAFGLGGILVEVLKDITFRLAPATHAEALSMLDGIAAAEILRGVRGAAGGNREALAAMIVNVSTLVADFPEIAELDLNPVFATPATATAADVRVVLDFKPPIGPRAIAGHHRARAPRPHGTPTYPRRAQSPLTRAAGRAHRAAARRPHPSARTTWH